MQIPAHTAPDIFHWNDVIQKGIFYFRSSRERLLQPHFGGLNESLNEILGPSQSHIRARVVNMNLEENNKNIYMYHC